MSASDHVYARKTDKTGRSTGRFARSKTRKGHSPIGEQFFWFGRAMLQSPAMAVLSGAAVKILLRIGEEHLAHGGAENGRLPVTHRDFKETGISGSTITLALAELEALGFIERTDPGRLGWGEDKGRPSTYRLTWIATAENSKPTNEWRQHKTFEDAQKAAASARNKIKARRAKARADADAHSAPKSKALAG